MIFGTLRKLIQQVVDPRPADPWQGWTEVPALPEVVEINLPVMEGEPGSLTNAQKDFLEKLQFEAPERLNYMQAGLVLNCIQYVRYLYAENLSRNLSQCPSALYLRLLPFMVSRPDIIAYLEKWDQSMMDREDSNNAPFARRKKNPIHLEIQRQFNDMLMRI